MTEVLSTIFYCLEPKRIEVSFDDGTVSTYYDVETYSALFPDRIEDAIALFNTNQIN